MWTETGLQNNLKELEWAAQKTEEPFTVSKVTRRFAQDRQDASCSPTAYHAGIAYRMPPGE